MKKTPLLALALIAFLLTLGFATLMTNYLQTHTITINPSLTLTSYLDDEIIPNDATIPWGAWSHGDIIYSNLTVVNTGNVNTNVTFHVANLPDGWLLTWTGNKTIIAPTEWVQGNLTLTVALDAEGAYTWDTIIRGTET